MTSDSDPAQVMLERVFLRRALLGDHDAFVVLGSMHSEQIYAIARNLSSNDEDALKLTQGAFLKASKRLTAIPAQMPFRIFVCRILVRDAIERLRYTVPQGSVSLERFLPRFEDGKHPIAQLSDYTDINGLAGRGDVPERIHGALQGLTPEDRAAFVLRIIEDFPLDEAAAILEVPASVVRQRVNRANFLLSGYVRHLAVDRPAA